MIAFIRKYKPLHSHLVLKTKDGFNTEEEVLKWIDDELNKIDTGERNTYTGMYIDNNDEVKYVK